MEDYGGDDDGDGGDDSDDDVKTGTWLATGRVMSVEAAGEITRGGSSRQSTSGTDM